MAQGRQIEIPLYSKAPFANYDIVVYLGGGLFALFIVWRYLIDPFGIFDLSELSSQIEDGAWTEQFIYLVILGILAYTVGHLVAYLSSHFIEGFVNKTLGSFSEIIRCSTQRPDDFKSDLTNIIIGNFKTNFGLRSNAILWLFHAPAGLWYWLMIQFRLFESLDTRLPSRMMDHLEAKIPHFFENVSLRDKRQWFRWVEYYTSYHAPVAGASMYNYLVISGFMRSIALVLLAATWFELFHLLYFAFTGEAKIHVAQPWYHWGGYAVVLIVGYVCALTSYTKFYRRYVEEAVLGFLLEVRQHERGDKG